MDQYVTAMEHSTELTSPTSSPSHPETSEVGFSNDQAEEGNLPLDIVTIAQICIGCVGIVTNFIVVLALASHQKLRKKIANIFIVNQVKC